MSVVDTELDTTLDDFLKRVSKKREHENKIIQWHIDAFNDGGVKPPYTVDQVWYNVSVWGDYDTETQTNPLNVEATLDALKLATKYARKMGKPVEKNYDGSDFEVIVTIYQHPDNQYDNIKIRYYASRESVCKKKFTGEVKVTPARVIPEKVEEVYEWECESISLLAP